METAIAESLPALGLFRCRELAEVLNTPKGDALLHNVQRAARLGRELLDDRQRDEYLTRLAEAEFDDDAAYGGLAAEEKRALLRRFLTEVITDRRELLAVLGLDWREVAPVLHKSRRKSRPEQMQALAAALREALAARVVAPENLPKRHRTCWPTWPPERPEDEAVERFLTDYGDSLPRATRNQLRRLRSIKKHQTTDFLAGVTYLGVELLTAAREALSPGATLTVRWAGREVGTREAEALLAFRTLYGGLETAMPGIRWELDDLWAPVPDSAPDEEEAEGEREKVIKTNLPFRVTLTDGEGQALAAAELIWHYRSDGPAAATLAHLQAEAQALSARQGDGPLFQALAPRLRIPIYNTCPAPNEVSDLDLSRPLASLGAWYRQATDLGAELRAAMQRVARREAQSALDAALARLEEAWAAFVKEASARGLLSCRPGRPAFGLCGIVDGRRCSSPTGTGNPARLPLAGAGLDGRSGDL